MNDNTPCQTCISSSRTCDLRVLCEWQHATIIWILEQRQFRINFLNFSETTLKNLY